MTGLRLGYVAARDAQLRERMKKALFYTASNVSSVVQYGGIGALEGPQDVHRRIPGRAAGAARPVLRGHPRARRRRAQRRAAEGRLLRVPADRSGVALEPDGGQVASLSWAMTEYLISRGPHRLRAGRRLRRERRGLRPVLLRARSPGAHRRARVDAPAVRLASAAGPLRGLSALYCT